MPQSDPPLISIIVTCKDRRHHLEQTLPSLLAQSKAEVVVVDYACSQGTAGWVCEQYPVARVFSVSGDPHFHLTRARNIGAANARGAFLLFVDADIALEGDLGAWIATQARTDHFYTASNPRSASLTGTVVCDRQVFDQVGGYDEAFRGWGWEDYDLYHRFAALPLREGHFSSTFLRAIPHGNEERQFTAERGGIGSRDKAMTVSRLYTNLKTDAFRLTGIRMDLKTRLQIMDSVKQAVRKLESLPPGETHELKLKLGSFRNETGHFCERQLVYQLNGGKKT